MSPAKIVECVPNFSEGRDRRVIDQIAQALGSVTGATLLDVDPGGATHRTVMTVVGAPEAVLEAAFLAIRTASELIDMSRHQGEHPRMGATDVCPFVPVAGIGMDECVELAKSLGRRVGEELRIPVYLYEHAATDPSRRNLADIRKGEYEGLPKKLADAAGRPDFGPATFNARSGATVIGARKFLIAYNVNLNSRSKKLASAVAVSVREHGKNRRDAEGKFIRDAQGVPLKEPGRLKCVKAVGWYIEEYARAQISANLTDFDVSNLHHVFDACDEEARALGARVTGSELVGLVPLSAMLAAGRHYLRRQGRSTGLPESQVIECAVQSLGLSELGAFDPREKIIEYRLKHGAQKLKDLTLEAFADELSSESPAPGGGSVAALCGTLAAGLCAMVGNLTVGKKGMEDVFDLADRTASRAQELKDAFLRSIDEDTDAFNALMASFRLGQATPAEKATRDAAILEATRGATMVPFSVLERTPSVLELAAAMLDHGNPNASSDAAAAASCARACAEGAFFNVLTNLADTPPEDPWSKDLLSRSRAILQQVRSTTDALTSRFTTRLRPTDAPSP